jgi:hypothetical protein
MALAILSDVWSRPRDQWILQIEGMAISREMYSYYLTQTLMESRFAALADRKPTETQWADIKTMTGQSIREAIAVQNELAVRNYKLDTAYKYDVSTQAAHLWRFYGNYYKSLGITKPTVTQAETAKAAKKMLFDALYTKAGKRVVPDAAIQAYFYGNYTAYVGVRVYTTAANAAGVSADLTPQQISVLKTQLSALVESINGGKDFFTAAQENTTLLQSSSPSDTVVKKDNPGDPPQFFEKIFNAPKGKVTLLEFPDFFLLARPINMRESPEEYYNGYREICLHEMKDAEFNALVDAMTATFRADENKEALNQLYADWKF